MFQHKGFWMRHKKKLIFFLSLLFGISSLLIYKKAVEIPDHLYWACGLSILAGFLLVCCFVGVFYFYDNLYLTKLSKPFFVISLLSWVGIGYFMIPTLVYNSSYAIKLSLSAYCFSLLCGVALSYLLKYKCAHLVSKCLAGHSYLVKARIQKIKDNITEAETLYQKAVDNGNSEARLELGVLWVNDNDPTKHSQGYHWLLEATKTANRETKGLIYCILSRAFVILSMRQPFINTTQYRSLAHKYLLAASKCFNPEANLDLAIHHYRGIPEFRQDIKKALIYFIKYKYPSTMRYWIHRILAFLIPPYQKFLINSLAKAMCDSHYLYSSTKPMSYAEQLAKKRDEEASMKEYINLLNQELEEVEKM